MNSSSKNNTIRDTLKKTRERRKGQICKQYELKLDRSHLNEESKQHLDRLFLEAKWLYNSIIASNQIFGLSQDHYKAKEVHVKVMDRFETRKLECLSTIARLRSFILISYFSASTLIHDECAEDSRSNEIEIGVNL